MFWSLGSLLTAGWLVIPSQLGGVFRAGMGLAHLLSTLTTPMAIRIRAFGKDPLAQPADSRLGAGG